MSKHPDEPGPIQTPLVWGGTPVDDTIMDLIKLAELAEADPKAARVLAEICEEISACLAKAAEEASDGR